MNTALRTARRIITNKPQKGFISRAVSLNGSLSLDEPKSTRLNSLVIEGSTNESDGSHMENTTLSLGGANLFDLSQNKYSGKSTIVSKTSNSITVSGKGSWISANIVIPFWERMVGKNVTISATVSKSSDTANAGFYVRWFVGSSGVGTGSKNIGVYGANVNGYHYRSGVVEKLDLEKYPNAKLCVAFYSNTDSSTCDGTEQITYSDIMVSYDDSPYEPYVPPQDVEIPNQVTLDDGEIVNLRLGKSDVIEVQGTHKRVWYCNLEKKHDITKSELAKDLLSLAISPQKRKLRVFSSLAPSRLEASFYSNKNPETVSLRVAYLCDGKSIKEEKIYSVRRGSGFEAHSVHIEGYKAINDIVRGVASDDTNITFNYERTSK